LSAGSGPAFLIPETSRRVDIQSPATQDVKGAPNAAGARQFINYVPSAAGQQTLKNQSFIIQGT